jgi:ubiquitin-protein ligase
MNVRLRRLQSDYDAVRRLARLHPRVKVEGVSGTPPDRYRMVLTVRSLREKGERLVIASQHRLEVVLPKGYPRDAPLFRMLTPVFHPNIAPHAVCIGDHWTAAESLDALIQRVGEMLAFQSYNVKSPLNGKAARWVEEHPSKLPLEKEEFFLDLGAAPTEEPTEQRCSNCGAAAARYDTCEQGHSICPDCGARCATCGGLLCLACGTTVCARCTAPCGNCGQPAARPPAACGHRLCEDCAGSCADCGRDLCLACGEVECPSCAAAGPRAPSA